METITRNIPVLALRGLTAFPGQTVSFDAERDISIFALDNAMENDRRLLAMTQKDLSTAEPGEEDLYTIGTVCHILQIIKTSDTTVRVIAEGESRARLHRLWQKKPFLQAQAELLPEMAARHTARSEALIRRTYVLFGEYRELANGIGEDFAAGEVAFIMQLGGLLEELTVAKARAGIEKLVHLTPRTARVLAPDGTETVVPAEQVQVGDTLRVLPGESVPVDGVICSGRTSINQAVMTGESLPVDKGPGDEVSSGTVNQFGAFEMHATKVSADSSIQRMIRLVQSTDAGSVLVITNSALLLNWRRSSWQSPSSASSSAQ